MPGLIYGNRKRNDFRKAYGTEIGKGEKGVFFLKINRFCLHFSEKCYNIILYGHR